MLNVFFSHCPYAILTMDSPHFDFFIEEFSYINHLFSYIRYTALIIEAITSMQEPNGVEIGAIFSFIEVCH